MTAAELNSTEKTLNQKSWVAVRKILTEDRSVKNSLKAKDMTILIFKKLLEVHDITPEKYFELWNTDFNKQFSFEAPIKKILELSTPQERKECAFDNKRVVFKLCWPEVYDKCYTKLTPYEIFFMKDSIMRGNFIHFSRLKVDYTNSISNKDDKNCIVLDESKNYLHHHYGAEIDELIYDAINVTWDTFIKPKTLVSSDNFGDRQLDGEEEKLLALAMCKSNGLKNIAKCFDVILQRGLYPSVLDFYMWNSPVEYQYKYLNSYLDFREAAKLPKLNYLDIVVEAMDNNKTLQNNQFPISR